jgi:uncharacterized protein YraI
VVLGAVLVALVANLVGAQALDPPPGSVLRVANTDGSTLNLWAGPSTDEAVAAELSEGDLLTVTGAGRTAGDVRWLPVRTAGGQAGWVSAQYAAVVSTPTPPTPTPMSSPVVLADTAQEPVAVAPTATPVPSPLEVEARLKYPDSRQREQEVTIWVTRGGAPVSGAIVYMTLDSGDDEINRVLDPTDEEGRTRRVFSSKKDKGTINLTISAVAPDGGEGKTTASYFRH